MNKYYQMQTISIKSQEKIKSPAPKKTPAEKKTPAKTTKEDCNICTETMAKSKFVSCPFCSFECCKKCVETFLLSLDDDNPRCMNTTCKKVWSLTFVANNFTQVFYKKTYRDRRTSILLDREKSMLPEAQTIIEEEHRKKLIMDKIKEQDEIVRRCAMVIKDVRNLKVIRGLGGQSIYDNDVIDRNKLENIMTILVKIYTNEPKIDYEQTSIKKVIVNIKIIKTNARAKINQLYIEYDNRANIRNVPEVKVVKVVKVVNMKCPANNCRGFVNNDYVCGLCKVFVCKHCRIVVTEEDKNTHECDKDLVKTVKLLAKDTKNCPSCATPIFKIDGCDQMYCTLCHTPFSWTNGTIDKGNIHNPHYYQFMRENRITPNQQNRNQNVNRDCRLPTINPCDIPRWSVIQSCLKSVKINKLVFDLVTNAHRNNGHINDILQRIVVPNYLEQRVSFLRNEIDETTWKEIVKRKQKKIEKDMEVNMVLQMVSITFKDFFIEFVITSFTQTGTEFIMLGYDVPDIHILPRDVIRKNIEELEDKIRNICIYANDALKTIKKHYNNIVPYFGKNAGMYTQIDYCPEEFLF